jgi:hypothetical protein
VDVIMVAWKSYDGKKNTDGRKGKRDKEAVE